MSRSAVSINCFILIMVDLVHICHFYRLLSIQYHPWFALCTSVVTIHCSPYHTNRSLQYLVHICSFYTRSLLTMVDLVHTSYLYPLLSIQCHPRFILSTSAVSIHCSIYNTTLVCFVHICCLYPLLSIPYYPGFTVTCPHLQFLYTALY